MLIFSVLYFGDHNLHGGVAKYASEEQFRELARMMREAFARADLPEAIHLMDQGFGGHTYSLKSLFKDEQRKVIDEILKPVLERAESGHRGLYEDEAPLLRFMRDCNIPLPRELKVTAEFALNSLLRSALQKDQLDPEQVQNLLEDVRILEAPLDQPTLEMTARRNLERKADAVLAHPRDAEALREFREQVAIVMSLPLPLVFWSVQNRCYELLHKVYPQMKEKGESEWVSEFEQLAALLSLRV